MLILADASSASTWLPALLSALAVTLVNAIFQIFHEMRLRSVEAQLARRGAFFMKKLERHEQLWPLVTDCTRAQHTLAQKKQQGGVDLAPYAKEIAEKRAVMKNFVYDNGLYFDDETRRLAQEFDRELGDPAVKDVSGTARHLERRLREVLQEVG